MPDHSQFNTDHTYPGRWTISFNNPPINIFVPTTIRSHGVAASRSAHCLQLPTSPQRRNP